MSSSSLKRWEREFRSAAKADNLELFRDHLHRLGLPEEAEALLRGTVLVVQACCTYASIDGQSPAKFLAMQKYRPADVGDARYAFTFDFWGKAFARVLVSSKGGLLDLADLYGYPWLDYKVCGYRYLWVSRTDGEDLSAEELAQIETEITKDLRFDYSEDELDFWFDDTALEGVLYVMLQDVHRSEGKDEDQD
jgi:hypothetical protein